MVIVGSESRTRHKNMLCKQTSEILTLKHLLHVVLTLDLPLKFHLQLYVSPATTVSKFCIFHGFYVCVSYDPHSILKLFSYRKLTYWFLKWRRGVSCLR